MMSRVINIRNMAASLVFVLSLILSSLTYAETFTVTNLDSAGDGSLRDAIIQANTNDNPGVMDEIRFQDGLTGTIFMNGALMEEVSSNLVELGQMRISEDVSIIGPGKDVITIDAANQSRIFAIEKDNVGPESNAVEIDPRAKVSISGLRFINGIGEMGGGGAILNLEELWVDSCEFYKNSADGSGGAILSDSEGIIKEIKDSYFIMNSADDSGGAIAAFAEEDIIKLAVEILPMDEPEIGKITGSTFDMNTAGRGGGAIILARTARAGEIDESMFTNNSAGAFGGAIYVENLVGILIPTGVSTNFAEEEYNIKYLTNSQFMGNTAGIGGAIHNDEGMILNISDCYFKENIAQGQQSKFDVSTNEVLPEPNPSAVGGAIMNFAGYIKMIERTTFSTNTSYGVAGAISNIALIDVNFPDIEVESRATPEIEVKRSLIGMLKDSTLDHNTALISGGAMVNGSSTVQMVNTTYTENKAADVGGALANVDLVQFNEEQVIEVSTNELEEEIFSAPIALISFSTFAHNEAGEESGALHEIEFETDPESIHIRHSVLAFNTPANCAGAMVQDASGNHSDDDSCELVDGDEATINLGPLADNGGPTMTLALLDGSDPIDGALDCTALSLNAEVGALEAGILVEADQRGAARPFNEVCDSGAFEFGAVASNFFHNSIFPALAGNINMIDAEEATPDAPVAFVWGFMPGSATVGGSVCNGTELGIKNPRLLATVKSSTEGKAEHVFFIPFIGDNNLTLQTQAIDVKTCAVSEVIEDIIETK